MKLNKTRPIPISLEAKPCDLVGASPTLTIPCETEPLWWFTQDAEPFIREGYYANGNLVLHLKLPAAIVMSLKTGKIVHYLLGLPLTRPPRVLHIEHNTNDEQVSIDCYDQPDTAAYLAEVAHHLFLKLLDYAVNHEQEAQNEETQEPSVLD